MDQITNPANLERERLDEPVARPRRWRWKATALGVAVAAGLFLAWLGLAPHRGNQAAAAPTPAAVVTVSQPLRRDTIAIANLYIQDLPIQGFTSEFSVVQNIDRESAFYYDKDGFLTRPAAISVS